MRQVSAWNRSTRERRSGGPAGPEPLVLHRRADRRGGPQADAGQLGRRRDRPVGERDDRWPASTTRPCGRAPQQRASRPTRMRPARIAPTSSAPVRPPRSPRPAPRLQAGPAPPERRAQLRPARHHRWPAQRPRRPGRSWQAPSWQAPSWQAPSWPRPSWRASPPPAARRGSGPLARPYDELGRHTRRRGRKSGSSPRTRARCRDRCTRRSSDRALSRARRHASLPRRSVRCQSFAISRSHTVFHDPLSGATDPLSGPPSKHGSGADTNHIRPGETDPADPGPQSTTPGQHLPTGPGAVGRFSPSRRVPVPSPRSVPRQLLPRARTRPRRSPPRRARTPPRRPPPRRSRR